MCGTSCESVTHYLLECPRYSVLRLSLLSAAAQVYGRGWSSLSVFCKVKSLLFGDPNLNVDDNIELFKNFQQFTKLSDRFR